MQLSTDKEIKILSKRLDAVLDIVKKQTIEINELKAENKQLKSENKKLTDRLQRYENPKNSNNSSMPPSQDENRPTRKSLRERSGKKAGGQKGRVGKTLKQVEYTGMYGCIQHPMLPFAISLPPLIWIRTTTMLHFRSKFQLKIMVK